MSAVLSNAQERARSEISSFVRRVRDAAAYPDVEAPEVRVLAESTTRWWAETAFLMCTNEGWDTTREIIEILSDMQVVDAQKVTEELIPVALEKDDLDLVEVVMRHVTDRDWLLKNVSLHQFSEKCTERDEPARIVLMRTHLAAVRHSATRVLTSRTVAYHLSRGDLASAQREMTELWGVRNSLKDVSFAASNFVAADHVLHWEFVEWVIGEHPAVTGMLMDWLLAEYLRFGDDTAYAFIRQRANAVCTVETQDFVNRLFARNQGTSLRSVMRANEVVERNGLVAPPALLSQQLRKLSTVGELSEFVTVVAGLRASGRADILRELPFSVAERLARWEKGDGDLIDFLERIGESTWGATPGVYGPAFRICAEENRVDWAELLLAAAERNSIGMHRTWIFHVVDVTLAAGKTATGEKMVADLNHGKSHASEILYGLLAEHFHLAGDIQNRVRIERWAEAEGRPVTFAGMNDCLPSFVSPADARGVERVMRIMTNLGHRPDATTWTALAAARSRQPGGAAKARRTVDDMRASGVEPDLKTWTTLLGIHEKNKQWREAEEVMDLAIAQGVVPDTRMWRLLLSSFPTHDENRERVLARMDGDVQAESAVIATMVEGMLFAGRIDEAREYLRSTGVKFVKGDFLNIKAIVEKFLKEGKSGDAISAMFIVAAHGGWIDANALKTELLSLPRHELSPVVEGLLDSFEHGCFLASDRVASVLLDVLSDRGRFQTADKLFDRWCETGRVPNVYLWNARMKTWAVRGDAARVLQTFEEMHLTDVEPDLYSWGILLSALSADGDMAGFVSMRERMTSEGIQPDAVIYSVLVSGFAEAGQIEAAEGALAEAGSAGVRVQLWAWATLAAAHGREGGPAAAEKVLDRVRAQGLEPDENFWGALVDTYAELADPEAAESVLERIPRFEQLASVRRQVIHESVVRAYARAHAPIGDIQRFLPRGDEPVSAGLLTWLAIALVREKRPKEAYGVLGRGENLPTFGRLVRCTAASRFNSRIFESELRNLVDSFELTEAEVERAFVRLVVALADPDRRQRAETLAREKIDRAVKFGRTPFAVLNETVGGDERRPWYRLMLAMADRFSKAAAAELLRMIDDPHERRRAHQRYMFARDWTPDDAAAA